VDVIVSGLDDGGVAEFWLSESQRDEVLNNHVILHSRTAYEDYPEPERRRDLIRLWLDA